MEVEDLSSPTDSSHAITHHALSLRSTSMLRATPLAQVLKFGGRILGNSAGTADTYRLSHPVDTIDCFISHNWSTPRGVKFLTLTLHFEHRWAWAFAFVYSMIVIMLSGCKIFPIFRPIYFGWPYATGIFCGAFATPIFLLCLCFGRQFLAIIRFRGPNTFLDKICIHQTDKEIQRLGIESLGAFITRSECMLAVFADTYLQKLWTVYELATFLCTSSATELNKTLIVCPPRLGVLVVSLLLVSYAISVSFQLSIFFGAWKSEDDSAVLASVIIGILFFLPVILVLTASIQKFGSMQQKAHGQISNFSTAQAKCFCEDDRPLVNGIIVAFMKSTRRCPPRATDQEALEAFDSIVRKAVPLALTTTLGSVGIPYSYIIIIHQQTMWEQCDMLCGMLQDGVPTERVIALVLTAAILGFAWEPLVDAFLMFGARRAAGFSGWQARLLTFCIALVVFMLQYAGRHAQRVVQEMSQTEGSDSMMKLCMVAIVGCVLLLLTSFIYCRHGVQYRTRTIEATLSHAAQRASDRVQSFAMDRMQSMKKERSAGSRSCPVASHRMQAIAEEGPVCTRSCLVGEASHTQAITHHSEHEECKVPMQAIAEEGPVCTRSCPVGEASHTQAITHHSEHEECKEIACSTAGSDQPIFINKSIQCWQSSSILPVKFSL